MMDILLYIVRKIIDGTHTALSSAQAQSHYWCYFENKGRNRITVCFSSVYNILLNGPSFELVSFGTGLLPHDADEFCHFYYCVDNLFIPIPTSFKQ